MTVYPANISELIREPNFGKGCERANGQGSDANFACGCYIRVFVRIDDEESSVAGIGYKTNGCGYMIAAAELAAARISLKPLAELHGLSREEAERVTNGLGVGRDDRRRDCIDAVFAAVRGAFNDHRCRLLEEFAGEKALICTCFGISEETIEQYVVANRPSDPFQVSEAIRAGSGCGSCRMLIQEIIDSAAV